MAPSVEERTRALKIKRRAFVLELTEFSKFLETYDPVASAGALKERLQDIETEYAAFAKTQSELDGNDDTGDLMVERISIKTSYFTHHGNAIMLLRDFTTKSIAASETNSIGIQPSTSSLPLPRQTGRDTTFDDDIELPRMNLPVFVGSYEDWPAFADQFKSAVHNNKRIGDAKKLNYLRSYVKGEAANVIQSFGGSAAHFAEAWAMLEERFNKPAIIVNKPIGALCDLHPVSENSSRDLRHFAKAVNEQTNEFWEIEEVPDEPLRSVEEQARETHFRENTRHESDSGRYTVKLPVVNNKGDFEHSVNSDTPNGPIKTFQLETDTYGTASAPFLSTRALHQLSNDEVNTYPRATNTLRNDFYVDDPLTRANSYEDALAIRDELIQITRRGGFELRQWSSNDHCLLESLHTTDNTEHMLLTPDESKKTLGLHWHPTRDGIQYQSRSNTVLVCVTKRPVLSRIAQLFDPLGLLGSLLLKATIITQRCVTCHRANPPITTYEMGNLPRDRVTIQRPFLATGVDYCGPLFIKEKRIRNTKKIKVFIAISVCLATKAAHIELVSDLTTDAFVTTLKRFIARRSKSTDFNSDSITNFVGANRELREIRDLVKSHTNHASIRHYLGEDNITRHLIAPRAPHFGGLSEAAGKSCKYHLTRVAHSTIFTYEAQSTYLTEIEAIVNWRPITPLSSDPTDLSSLTPGHFLIGESMTSIVEPCVAAIPANRLSMWQHIQQMRQHFCKRWRKDYLHDLTVRKRWHSDSNTNVTVDIYLQYQ